MLTAAEGSISAPDWVFVKTKTQQHFPWSDNKGLRATMLVQVQQVKHYTFFFFSNGSYAYIAAAHFYKNRCNGYSSSGTVGDQRIFPTLEFVNFFW